MEVIVVFEQLVIYSVVDLKGKCVGLNKGFDVNYLLVVVLEKVGFSYKDIILVYLLLVDVCVVFQCGVIDVWVIWDLFFVEVEINVKV